MVDFGELKDKAEGLVSGHEDQIKQGIDKIGDFVGERIGHDKVDPVEEKLSGFVDSLGRNKPSEQ
ncbi:MT0933-like antitoxin protein [Nakamurella panacisegetis]|uniref:MT0933-like antitoxin protein n=1 Tax=Nakamurella panacisegetis TaxID=1090615 RepID=A0A1H0MKF9_9ACTN|nr:antitoxin [Nakamurella panacisegetis]SDO80851.1 MT0933-like antitoxin protein [Nakamurella panacisegetis]